MPLTVIVCPICRKETTWEQEPRGPFCSERCRLVDLGTWFGEGYRIPEQSTDEREDELPTGSE